MSVVEDVRQVIQDFLAPELRSITARFDAIDRRFEDITAVMNARYDTIDRRFEDITAVMNARYDAIDRRFEEITSVMNARFDSMNTRVDSLGKDIAQVKELLEIDRRLTKLEAKQAQVA